MGNLATYMGAKKKSAKKARVWEDEGGREGCDSWSAGVAMGGADSDDEMGMGVDDEYGLGWNDEVAPSRRKADREAKASRARAGVGVATVATTGGSLCHAESHRSLIDGHLDSSASSYRLRGRVGRTCEHT